MGAIRSTAATGGWGSSGAPPAQRSQKVLADQVRLLYRQAPLGILGTLVAATLLTALLWRVVPLHALTAWITAVVVLTAARYLTVLLFQRRDDRDPARWARVYTLGSAGSGIAWGSAGLLVAHYGSVEHHVLMMLVLGGIVAVALSTMAVRMSTFVAFLLPALAPVTVWFALQSDPVYHGMAAMAAVFVGLLLLTARTLNQTLVRSFVLGSENMELIHKLKRARDNSELAKRQVERANRELQAEIRERERAEQTISASRHELRAILNNMQDTIYRTDLDGRLLWLSPSVRRLLGYEPDELSGDNWRELFADEGAGTDFYRALDANGGVLEDYECRLRRKDGTVVWVSTNAHYFHDDSGLIQGIEGSARDITERKSAEEALYQEKELAQVTLSSIGDGVVTTDVHGRVQYLNPVAEQFTGWPARDARGHHVLKVLNLVDELTREPTPDPVQRCLKDGHGYCLPDHTLLLHREGHREYAVEVTTAPIRDSAEQIIGSVLVFHDVTKLRGLAKQMSYQATHDALTGLINRREFERRVQAALDSAMVDDVMHALCYLDLDQFKVVNDTCGHGAGDELLKQLTSQLRANIRETDTLARLGGDEFGVLLQNCSLAKAQEVTEVLRRVVEKFRFVWQGKVFKVGVSAGLVPITKDSGTLSDLLSAADSACYVAKDQGRNRVHLFAADDKALAQRHGEMQWMQRIQQALEQDRFELYFQVIQPVSDTGTHPQHLEILVRMVDEHGKLVQPLAFIPSAERYHLMPAVDRWVVDRTFEILADRHGPLAGLGTCSINLSGQSLSDESFLRHVVQGIEDHGLKPESLCFEITETAMMANLMNAGRFISVLRDMGCRFALDDFGSGLSSFSYLKNLPVDYLKLDGSYVKNLATDTVDREMVRAINEIGHVMGIRTIAEFVEDESTFDALKQFHVDYAQGYWLDRPRPVLQAGAADPGADRRAHQSPKRSKQHG